MSRLIAAIVAMFTLGVSVTDAAEPPAEIPQPKPVPRMQALPQPHDQISFQREGREVARYHFAPDQRRPFVFPVIGPAGRSLTRMGHPRDPVTHSHHNSVWISHQDVGGISFWEDRAKGKIVHQRVEEFDDTADAAYAITVNHWVEESTGRVILVERRRTQVQLLERDEWMLVIDMQLAPPKEPVVLGKTAFGLIGVRMAKTIGTNDGGGMIRNSEGGINEKAIFWKPARWVDYSGPITDSAIEGITLMDHPSNPNHPNSFHVRGDGWMGCALTLNGPMTLDAGKPLRLKYGLYIHSGRPAAEDLNKRWEAFAKTELMAMPVKK